jgi:hypothetical protein
MVLRVVLGRGRRTGHTSRVHTAKPVTKTVISSERGGSSSVEPMMAMATMMNPIRLSLQASREREKGEDKKWNGRGRSEEG